MDKSEKRKLIAKIIQISIVILVVTGLCVALAVAVDRQKKYRNELENLYEKSYFDAMDSLENVETKLKKLNVMGTKSIQQTTLNDIWRECETAQTNLAQLSSQDGAINDIIKFLNQLGDFCYYLSLKLNDGALDSANKEMLVTLSEIVSVVRTEMQSVQGKIADGGRLLSGYSTPINYIGDILSGIQHSTIDYPELIYDGPFSDGLNDRDAKLLKNLAYITPEQADERVNTIFAGTGLQIISRSETSGSLESYMYVIKSGGKDGSLQLTKKGGMLVYYNVFKDVTNPQLEEEACIAKGSDFLKKAGYDGMEPVWASNSDSIIYINYAYVQDGVIIYPDLVKVKISAEDGSILGVEAQNFIYNHTDRKIVLTEGAQYTLSPNLTLVKEAYALIPTEWNTEIMAKEYICTYGGNTFYIYVNLKTGEEIKVMILIDDNGKLLI